MRRSSPIFPRRVRRPSRSFSLNQWERPKLLTTTYYGYLQVLIDCGTRCHCDLRQRRLKVGAFRAVRRSLFDLTCFFTNETELSK